MSDLFNLELAIAEWRRNMASAGIKPVEALDELESHLRDEVEQHVREGSSEAHAFATAVARIGSPEALRTEFRKAGQHWWNVVRKFMVTAFGSDDPLASLEEFAPAARQSLALAPEAARQFRHDFIGTEHVLLALLEGPSSVAAGVLNRLGVNPERVRNEIQKIVGQGGTGAATIRIPFTPRARRALQLARREARTSRRSAVSPEHILLGLLLEGGGVAALVLKTLGVDSVTVRKEIHRSIL
jgi:hypothetical protein